MFAATIPIWWRSVWYCLVGRFGDVMASPPRSSRRVRIVLHLRSRFLPDKLIVLLLSGALLTLLFMASYPTHNIMVWQHGVPEPTLYNWVQDGRLLSRSVKAGAGSAKLVTADAATIANLKTIRASPALAPIAAACETNHSTLDS